MIMSSYKLKIVLCGDYDSGKTSLIMRFIKSRFASDYKLTVGVDILTKEVELENGQIVTLSIWDIGGQERFSFIRSTFYRGSVGALLVFDLSRVSSWNNIINWRAELTQFAGDVPFILIGNKLELIQKVGEVINREECRKYAEDNGGIYIETSSKKNIAVDEAFLTLTKMIVDKYSI
jgi:small GTP-binding protein